MKGYLHSFFIQTRVNIYFTEKYINMLDDRLLLQVLLGILQNILYMNFPSDTVDSNLPASAGHMGLIPGLGRFHMPWSNQDRVPKLSLSSRACETAITEPASCNY